MTTFRERIFFLSECLYSFFRGHCPLIKNRKNIMENILEFKSFRSPSDAGWEEAWKLYEESFPRKETRSLADHLRALEDPRFTADGIWHECEVVGRI